MRNKKKFHSRRRPLLHVADILAWADEHHERTGKLPTAKSGRVWARFGEKWKTIDRALQLGRRGLPGKWSLAQLLAEYRGYRNRSNLPKFTIKQILQWADSYYARIGRWPHPRAGKIPEAPGETWLAVGMALLYGARGLPGGSSLAKLLLKHRKVRNVSCPPKLSVTKILLWADAHHRRAGNWPTKTSGPVHQQPGETWEAVDCALRLRGRGLRIRTSLPRLLRARRSVRMNYRRSTPITIKQILVWAESHRKRTGRWPNEKSGPIPGTAGENWNRVATALRDGRRGLPKGWTLGDLWAKHRRVYHRRNKPKLTLRQIKRWIKSYHRRHHRFPSAKSGPILEAPYDTWAQIASALRFGSRGLRGRSSLATFIQRHFSPRSK